MTYIVSSGALNSTHSLTHPQRCSWWAQWCRNEFESGGTGPKQKWGAPIRRQAPEIVFSHAPPLFLGSKSTISRFGERFRNGQFLVCCFSYSRCPPCPAICKSGGGARVPRSPWSRRHWMSWNNTECHRNSACIEHLAFAVIQSCELPCQTLMQRILIADSVNKRVYRYHNHEKRALERCYKQS